MPKKPDPEKQSSKSQPTRPRLQLARNRVRRETRPSFRRLLFDAIAHFKKSGYTSQADLSEWITRLSTALDREMLGDDATKKLIGDFLTAVYHRDVNRGAVVKRVPKVMRYTLDRIAPELRAELDKKIFASVELIKLNRTKRKQQTLQRFAGWVSSMPAKSELTASSRQAAREIAREIGTPAAQLRREARRVAIDQGHKLSAAVASVVARGEGAIAAIWHDRGANDKAYDARPDHLRRSGSIYFVRDSWALEQGLLQRRTLAYIDEIEQPAELPFCSCTYEYITSPHDIPVKHLTAKGRAWVSGVRLDAVSTPAQRSAGNYPKKHLEIAGLDVSIETEQNEIRTGVGSDGKLWAVPMPADYGYISRTTGADDEQIDCYVGPYPASEFVWVIAQCDPDTNAYDEDKVMLGFDTQAGALKTYDLGFSDGRGMDRVLAVFFFTAADFADKIKTGADIHAGPCWHYAG